MREAREEGWPRATIGLLATILAVFFCEHVAGFRERPIVAALRCGAIDGGAVFQGGEVWRLITAAFVHFPIPLGGPGGVGVLSSLPHILLNGWALLQLGSFIESIWGPVRLVLLFVLSAIGCSLASAWFSPAISGGASGGIFGLLGFLVAARALHAPDVRVLVRDTFGGQLVFWAGLAIVVGASGVIPIDQAGHLGGLATGLVLGAVVRETGEPGPGLLGLARVLLIATTASLAAAAFQGEKSASTEAAFEDAVAATLAPEPDAAAAGKALDRLLVGPEATLRRVVGRSPWRALGIVEGAVAAVRSSDALRFAEESAPLVGPPWSGVLLATGHLATGDEAGGLAALAPVRSSLSPAARAELALFYERRGWSGAALSLLDSAAADAPKDAAILNEVAWVLLTARDARYREPRRGLELARRSVELAPDQAESLDTLAEGERQAGLAADALAHERRALELARKGSPPELVKELTGRLANLERGSGK